MTMEKPIAKLRRKSWTLVSMARVLGKATDRQKVVKTEGATGTNVDVRAELKVLQDEDRNKTGFFKYTFQNGDWYEGNWLDGALHGKGTFHYHSGNVYTGEWANNKRHGNGKFNNNVAGTTYDGAWKNDMRHGKGTSTDKEGNQYTGDWLNGQMSGSGSYKFVNGDRYEGSMSDNDFSGNGTFWYANGDKYEGEWRNGQQTGTGTFYYRELQHKYTGKWYQDKKNGHGKYVGTDFEYDGEWKNDTMCGTGTYTYASGDRYVGEWRDDNEHGHGVYYFADGSRFDGTWNAGRRNGKGVFTAVDGAKYDGDWEDNLKVGHGIYYYPNGDKYDGEWDNDAMHGEGVYHYKSGKKYNVVYQNGNCVSKKAIAGSAPQKSTPTPPPQKSPTPPPPPSPPKQEFVPSPPAAPRPPSGGRGTAAYRPTTAERYNASAEGKASQILEAARFNSLNLMQALEDPDPDASIADKCRAAVPDLRSILAMSVNEVMKEEASVLADQISELLNMWDDIQRDLNDSRKNGESRADAERRREEEERRRREAKSRLDASKSETRSKLDALREKRRLEKEAKEEAERIAEQLAEQKKKRDALLNNDAQAKEWAQKESSYEKEIRQLKAELANRPTAKAAALREQIERENLKRLELEKATSEEKIRQQVEAKVRKEIDPNEAIKAKEEELKAQEEKLLKDKEEQIKLREAALKKRVDAVRESCQQQLEDVQAELQETINLAHGGMSEAKKMEYELKMEKMKASLTQIQQAATNLDYEVASDKDIAEVERLRGLYQKELKERKEIYNQLVDLKGAVRVFARVCPRDGTDSIKYLNSETLVLGFQTDGFKARTFEFDRAFPPTTDVAEIMEDTLPLISSVADGFNVCIFAYGPTGTGKSHTMCGPGGTGNGVYKASLGELFRILNGKRDEQDSIVEVSAIEVYNEQVKDLQNGRNLNSISFSDGVTEISGIGLTKVSTPGAFDGILAKALNQRTKEKEDRSHMIVFFNLTVINKDSGKKTTSKLALIDMAGNEKLPASAGADAQGITRALGAMGDCLAGAATKSKNINYSASMLTRCVQDCISGKAKTLMFATLTPVKDDLDQSLQTLLFAARCRGQEEEKKGKK